MPHAPRILIVDDEPLMVDYLIEQLTGNGYELDTAASGRAAIDSIQREAFELVVLDIGLPDINGYQVMENIHKINSDILVIMITGETSVESAVKALRIGASDYLRKPFKPEDLLKTINNALDRQKLERARRSAQTALGESEERFRNLVENSLTGICIIQNNRIVYQNPEHKKLFGHLPAFFEIKTFEDIHPDDVKKVNQLYQNMQNILAGKLRTTEINFRFYPPGKQGSKVDVQWVQCRASIFNYQGDKALIVNVMDITRTRELEQLVIIKNRMLSLGQVAAGIAHEIRNPLTGINSYLYALKDHCERDDIGSADMPMVRQILGQIQIASNKIETVIKRVLDFSKPGSPKMVLVDITKSLEEAVTLSAISLQKSGIQIKQSWASTLPQCYADPQLMEQVILNLINNSARAMEKMKGQKVIEITTFARDNRIFIEVSDSGPGMLLEHRDKIFEPFFTTRADGSGIGLSIALRIISDHSGTIDVGKSKWGGAEFKIELPIEKRINPR